MTMYEAQYKSDLQANRPWIRIGTYHGLETARVIAKRWAVDHMTTTRVRDEQTKVVISTYDAKEQCPGHVASAADAKVCGRCGVHIDSLRLEDEESDGLEGIAESRQEEDMT